MANEVPAAVVLDNDLREQAAQNTLAANPLVGVRLEDILDSARLLFGQMLSSPGVAAQEYLRFVTELGRIATGSSDLAPDAKDKRFADPAWKDSAIYRALAQCYLAWGGALNHFVDEAKMDKRDAERARFVVSLLIDAMAPTNSISGQSGRLEEACRDTGREFHPRPGKPHARSGPQWRLTGTSRQHQICGGQEPRNHSRSRGVSQPGVGVNPIPTYEQ